MPPSITGLAAATQIGHLLRQFLNKDRPPFCPLAHPSTTPASENLSTISPKWPHPSNIHDESAIGTSIYRSEEISKATRIFDNDFLRR